MADEIYGDKYFELPDWLVGRKYKEQRQKFDFNQEELDKFKDLNYKPKSILERFTENPDYMKQPTLTPLTLPRRDDFDSSDLKMFPSIHGIDNAIGDEAALISAFANTQADKVRKERADKEAKTEKEKFVDKDTVLGRIFDRRVKPGNELSNNEKAFAYIRNISDSLLERREVGGKEGTSTLSRILGPGGGIGEGSDEIKALQKNAIALREKGENKKAAEQDKAILREIQKLDYEKTQAEIGRIDSETTKNIADAISGGDKPKAIKLAEYQARIRGFNVEKDPQAYYAEVDKIMSVGISQGQSSVYETIQGMELRLSGMNDDDPGKQQLEEDIAGLRARSTGTTVDNYVPKDKVYRDDGTPRT